MAGLFKARIFILGIALALTAVALFAFFRARPELLIGWLSLSALVALPWACGAYALLLSARLAVIAAVAPWIGWLWLLGIGAFWNVPQLATATFPFIIAGALITAFGLHAMATMLAQGADKMIAVRSAYTRAVGLGTLTLLATCAGMAATAYPKFDFGPVIPVGFAMIMVTCIFLPPLAAGLLPFNEGFIARTNRARERRERLISYFAILSVPRWAFAAVGIAAVLSAIIYFEKSFALLWQTARTPYAIAFVAMGMLGALGLRNWRCFFSCSVPPFLASIFGVWVTTKLWLPPNITREIAQLFVLFMGSAIGAGFVYFLAAPMITYQRAGDPTIIAFSRALNETGAAIIILGSGLALALLAITGGSPIFAILPVFHIVCALILFPAIATALDDLFPRRRSLKELYRAR